MPILRRLRPTDALDVAFIRAAAWQSAYRGILPGRYLARLRAAPQVPYWRARLARADELGWGIQVGAHLVGYATAGPCRDPDLDEGFSAELYELYVHPRMQRRGLGREMMLHVWSELEAEPFRWGVLWVLADNVAARRFYERCGLVADGQRRMFTVAGKRVPAVRYSLPLNPVDPLKALAGSA
ncbi:MAG: GNAT family N-acetyltransferase [Myxococcota bacterium]